MKDRLARTLVPTERGSPEPRVVDPQRYEAAPGINLGGKAVLLLDDTWASGGHAESAAGALLAAGVAVVSLVVVGRHLQPNWQPEQGSGLTSHDYYEKLPDRFDWASCAVH